MTSLLFFYDVGWLRDSWWNWTTVLKVMPRVDWTFLADDFLPKTGSPRGAGADTSPTALGRGHRLTPPTATTNIIVGAEVAQSVEHSTENAGVVSSILTLGTLGGG